MKMSYDTKCRNLAVAFLDDHYDPIPETKIHELAQVIQDSIEDWLAGEGKDAAPKPVPLDTWAFFDGEFQKIFGKR